MEYNTPHFFNLMVFLCFQTRLMRPSKCHFVFHNYGIDHFRVQENPMGYDLDNATKSKQHRLITVMVKNLNSKLHSLARRRRALLGRYAFPHSTGSGAVLFAAWLGRRRRGYRRGVAHRTRSGWCNAALSRDGTLRLLPE